MRFSLTFWLVVAALLLGTFRLIVPRMGCHSSYSRIMATVTQVSAFKNALNTFNTEVGRYPNGQFGLQELLHAVPGATNWHGPYLDSDRIPTDVWGHDYVYRCPGHHNPDSYDITSAGPDGQIGTEDDIGNWVRKQ